MNQPQAPQSHSGWSGGLLLAWPPLSRALEAQHCDGLGAFFALARSLGKGVFGDLIDSTNGRR